MTKLNNTKIIFLLSIIFCTSVNAQDNTSYSKNIVISAETSNKTTNLKENAKSILSKMLEADRKNQVFQAVFSNYSKGDMKNGKHTGKISEATITAKMTFKKPSKVILNVIDSPETMARGATLLYLGGDKVKVKAAGIWGLFPITFSINNPIFENTRGHKPLTAMIGLERITRNDAKVDLIGTTSVGKRKAYLLRVETPEKLDNEITHEIYAVDMYNYIVLSAEMFVNNDLVSRYRVKDIKTNINVSDDFFKL